MVLSKEYRICMPLTVEEYNVGQLYMIARHSREESTKGEGVEVVANNPYESELHGKGQFTEKRIYLNDKLPYWAQNLIPRFFYVTEKAWNYYPYTETEYTCSFVPKFQIFIRSRYEGNPGTSENCINLTEEELAIRTVDFVDIAFDEISPDKYKIEEDPKIYQSKKTGRGPLKEGWKDDCEPIMCSYKLVNVSFEVWGLQTRVEDWVHRVVRDVLLHGHRRAYTWVDEWHGMTMEDVREYEKKTQEETNIMVMQQDEVGASGDSSSIAQEVKERKEGEEEEEEEKEKEGGEAVEGTKSDEASKSASKSWFSWS